MTTFLVFSAFMFRPSPYWRLLKVRLHRNRSAAAGRLSREIAAVCDLVTPDTARQLRAVQCEEKPSS